MRVWGVHDSSERFSRSPVTSGWQLDGKPVYLCRRDAEELFEVSGELVGAKVTVRGDDVLDGRRCQRGVTQVWTCQRVAGLN